MREMKMKRLRMGACLLLAAGLLGGIISLGVLISMPESLQYAVAAAGETDIKEALLARENAAEQLSDCTSAIAVGAAGETVSVSAGEKSGSATIYAVGEGWFEVYPVFLLEGRRMTETELRQGERVALLDSGLAFSLFGAELPSDARARIGEVEYRVIGTIRHRRSVGEAEAGCAYVPLLSAPEAKRDAVIIAARPIEDSGAGTMFESAMRSLWRSDGCFYSIRKEAMRQMMLPRVLLLIFGMSGILALLRRMNALFSRKAGDYREKLRWNYFGATLPALMRLMLLSLAGYGAIVGLMYALFAFSVQPLTVFTEWVPENIVELTSLKNVFWSLMGSAAKLVKTGTRELRRIEFYGAVLRWSTIAVLAGRILALQGRAGADRAEAGEAAEVEVSEGEVSGEGR